MMKAHPYSFLTFILITLAFLFSARALAEDIDAKLSDTSDASSFQVKNSSDSVLMKVQSGGNVGIGTTTPSSKLHLVDGTFMIHNGTADLSFEAGLPSAISSWNGLDIKTMGTSRLRIETSGNIGIGTADPKEMLQIGDRLTFHAQVDGSSSWRVISNNSYWDTAGEGNDKRIVSGYASAMAFTDIGDILFRTAGTGPAGGTLDGGDYPTWDTPPLIVKNDGKIGIGTSDPSVKLDIVNGSIQATDNADVSLTAHATASDSRSYLTLISSTDSEVQRELRIVNDGAEGGEFRFNDATNDAVRMVIDEAGKVGIGTTTPADKLDINGNVEISGEAGKLVFPASHYDTKVELYKNGDEKIGTSDNQLKLIAGSGETDNIAFFGDSTEVMRVETGNAKVGIGTDAPNSSLHVNGSFSMKYTNISSTYTTDGDAIIGIDPSGGNVTVTLAAADNVAGRLIIIKNETAQTGTGTILVQPASGTIDNSASYSIDSAYGFVRVYSDGTNWFTIGN